MNVEEILRMKGSAVETASPDTNTVFVVHEMMAKGIGAVVVSPDGEKAEGIVSERDIVRGLNKHGAQLMELTAADVMSRRMSVCSPSDSLKQVMAEMTRARNRHVVVLDRGKLCGLVSIGDIVKNRLEELELETNVLRDAYRATH